MIFKYIFPFISCRFVCLKIFSPFFLCTGHLWLVISCKSKISHQTVMEMLPITINLHLWMSRGTQENPPRTFRHLGLNELNKIVLWNTRTSCPAFNLSILEEQNYESVCGLNWTQNNISQLLLCSWSNKGFIIIFTRVRWTKELLRTM